CHETPYNFLKRGIVAHDGFTIVFYHVQNGSFYGFYPLFLSKGSKITAISIIKAPMNAAKIFE
ncbi:MAG TPA: hypothetical protein VKU38_16320, partial [Ktedonobacteraceae bacterium]|nr:hypothetical protein [Ktedonobacteraceae bacterium]